MARLVIGTLPVSVPARESHAILDFVGAKGTCAARPTPRRRKVGARSQQYCTT
jgi:hypothetical protein